MSTEDQPPKNLWIDQLSINDATRTMLENQEEALLAVNNALPQINRVIVVIYNRLKKYPKSRLIYAGAGTSARVGLQDGVELYPTFGWPRKRVNFIIAGGEKAVFSSIEGAEDDINSPHEIANEIKFSKEDVLIAIAASGNTPFTRECVLKSKENKALSIAISNNKDGEILKFSDYGIVLDTGFEIIAGSTRLKAATAQKICLNIMSSMIMTKLGFVKNGLMTNLVPANEKLVKRKKQILTLISKRENEPK